MNYLDKTGLARLWEKIKGKLGEKAESDHTHTLEEITDGAMGVNQGIPYAGELEAKYLYATDDITAPFGYFTNGIETAEIFAEGTNGQKSVWVEDLCDAMQSRSSTPYATGRMWIDGQTIYRVDFSVVIPYGGTIWNRGYLYMWEIAECYQQNDPTFSTIINCNAVQTTVYYDAENDTYTGDSWYATTLLPMNYAVWKLQIDDFLEGDGYGIMINGFYEYVREATASTFIEVL